MYKYFSLLIAFVSLSFGQGTPGLITAYASGGGSAQAQTVTVPQPFASLYAGMATCWLPTAANTAAAPTLAINGLTAKTITKLGTTALVANDITTAAVACVIYDGTEFQLQNPQTASSGGGGGLGSVACSTISVSTSTYTLAYSGTVNCNIISITGGSSGSFTVTLPTPSSNASGPYVLEVTNVTPTATPITYGGATQVGLPQPDASSANAVTDIWMVWNGSAWHPSAAPVSVTASGLTAGQIYASNGTTGPAVAANANNLSAPAYVAGGGTAQAQTVTLSPAIPALAAGQTHFCFLPLHANTGAAPTIAVNGLTATAVTKVPNNAALIANDMITTAPACVIYDGTQFELQNPQTATAGSGSSRTLFISLGGTNISGGSNVIQGGQCTVQLSSGFTIGGNDGDSPTGPIWPLGGNQKLVCWLDLGSWDGNNLTIRFYTAIANGNSGGGTIIWTVAASCKTFIGTGGGVDWGSTYAGGPTSANTITLTPGTAYKTYMTSATIPTSGASCTAGAGNILSMLIQRGADSETQPIALTSISITGVF